MKRYIYEFPHPAVAVDITVFALREGKLCVLLIERGEEPFKGQWALPGGFVRADETVEAAAARELREETGVADVTPIQFGIYSEPDRDQRERVISIAYLACVVLEETQIVAGSDAANVSWTSLDDIRDSKLAFDHAKILRDAFQALKSKLKEEPLVGEMIPAPFRISDLQLATEAVIGAPIDKRNFRRLLDEKGWLEMDQAEARGRHRPAKLYHLKK